jgi:hypothetical protein
MLRGPSSAVLRDVLMLLEANGFELSLCLTLMTTRRVYFGALSF